MTSDISKQGIRYNQAERLAAMTIICDEIASSNKGIKSICDNNESLPSHDSVYRWLMDESKSGDSDKQLSEMYARAKEQQTEYLADEILGIADDTSRDEDIEGNANHASVQRDRLRIDSRKWLMAKLNRRKYGDKVEHEHSGNIGVSLEQRLIAARDRIERDITPVPDAIEHDNGE